MELSRQQFTCIAYYPCAGLLLVQMPGHAGRGQETHETACLLTDVLSRTPLPHRLNTITCLLFYSRAVGGGEVRPRI